MKADDDVHIARTGRRGKLKKKKHRLDITKQKKEKKNVLLDNNRYYSSIGILHQV